MKQSKTEGMLATQSNTEQKTTNNTKERFVDDTSFRLEVQSLFERLFENLENVDCDEFEIQMQTGSFVITFEEDNSVFMLSQQTPTHEIWLSANYEAWHFQYFSEGWFERDTQISLQCILQDLFSTKLDEQVDISL